MDEKQRIALIAMFKSEAGDHLSAINRDLLAVERSSDGSERQVLLESIFRDAHSLKGAARAVGFTHIEAIAHNLESVFGAARRDQIELSSTVCDVLYEGLDTIAAALSASHGLEEAPVDIGDLVERLEMVRQGQIPASPAHKPISQPVKAPVLETPAGQEKPATPPTMEKAPAAPVTMPHSDEVPIMVDETIRVTISKIEALMAQAGELLVSKISAAQHLADLRELRLDMERIQKELSKHTVGGRLAYEGSRESDRSAVMEFLAVYHSSLSTLCKRVFALEKRFEGEILRLELATSNLQDGIRRVRMMPFDNVLGGFQRMVRDLARELGKDVVLNMQGATIELDKKVLEEIRDPLMHLLRNAIDHGIEMPAERQEQGKPQRGSVTLTVAHQGSLVSITVEDDGQGIDVQAIRRTALKAGLIGQDELDTLTDQDLMHMTLLPGVTTSRQVTDLSGRGIGLDVVRQKVQDLQGRIDIESWPGRGTRFRLTVPVSLATARGLLARIMDEVYVLPLSSIQKVVTVASDDVHTVAGREMIAVNGRQTALVPLATVLERPTLHSNPLDTAPAVVLQVGATQAAFVVDELLGEQEMIVKGLGAQLVHVRNVAGATLLGSGRVVMILNPAELIRSIQRDGTRSLPAFAAPLIESAPMPTILVVDDSITTRTLEKNILEAAGYWVITAVDGIEALGYLASDDCSLVVADVQMPRMNGFELTRAIKEHEQFGHLPVILVTSLESQEDRSQGLTAGADAYIVKSAFDQEDLLSTIRQMLSEA